MPPYLISTFKDSVVSPGASVELGCSAKGKPRPSMSWMRDGEPISTSDKIRIESDVVTGGKVRSKVRIKNILVEDSGVFQCIVENRLGNVSHSENIQVYGLPMVRPMRNITVVAGQNALVKCHIVGYPIGTIQWTKGEYIYIYIQ